MSLRTVRRLVALVCVAGVAAMIASSVVDNDGAALGAGVVTAVAMLCLIVATSVTAAPLPAPDAEVELASQEVEDGVAALSAKGADDEALRTLVGSAVRLGRLTAHPTRRQ